MPKRKILTVEFELAHDGVESCDFRSDKSLLDWDIILFKPDISDFINYSSQYQGKPSLSDSASFRLKEKSEHWRSEIWEAVQSGKLVVVFLTDLVEVFVDTGQRTYSGTGRNQKTTIHVSEFDNYRCIPAVLAPRKTRGTAMRLTDRGRNHLAGYWKEFGNESIYKVLLEGEKVPSCIVTSNGDKAVGAIYSPRDSSGALVVLPDLDFYQDSFLDENDGDTEWTKEAKLFAAKLISSVIDLQKSIKGQGDITPEPEWAKSSEFALENEHKLRQNLLKLEEQIEKAQRRKENLISDLRKEVQLRNLLFEKGKPLEHAIIEALRLLGFKANQYQDEESEFDAVFQSKEGRLIGEAEGRDNKAISIEKLRQLEMNIHEDLERDEVTSPAKAVLFGNPFRLVPPGERADPFTRKCLTASQRSSTALIFTPELFDVAQYLSNNKDAQFAKKCRIAILDSVGLVEFPAVPKKQKKAENAEHARKT